MAVGNAALLRDLNVIRVDLEVHAEALREDGATALFVAVDSKPADVIAVADPIKATTLGALDALRSDGIRIGMVTGDNRTTAQAVAVKLGITEVEADVLPAQKNAIVRRHKSEGRVVAMAGDGVNDAPALAAADVGIAMGTGTDVAIQSAGPRLQRGGNTGGAGALYPAFGLALESHDCRSGHEPELRVGDWQCASSASHENIANLHDLRRPRRT